MTAPAVDVAALRGWIRRTQWAHRSRSETAGTVYFVLLFVAIVGGMVHRPVAAVFWPSVPDASRLTGPALVAAGAGILFLAMRRLGPLGLSRPAASWLLPAPVSRRRLLAPSLWLAIALAAGSGALLGVAVAGHALARPAPGSVTAIGALAGVFLLLLALAAQAGRRWPAVVDGLAGLLVAAGLAGFVVDTAVDAPPAPITLPSGAATLTVAVLAVLDAGLLTLAVSRLAGTPNERILESATTFGTLLDSAFGVEPSFVTDMFERRYWARRRLRSVRLSARVPALVAQDLLLVRRRPRRLVLLAGAVALPALFAHAPRVLLAAAILVGGLVAATVPAANIRTDAANPVLLRLLGLDWRRAISQRLWVPGVLAGIWYTASLALLRALGDLPAGPWAALGLALAPVGAIAAVRKARVGMVRNDLLPLDTPMGTLSPGPLLSLVVGLDALLLGLPGVIQIAGAGPLSWTGVVIQAAVSALATRAYVSTAR
jgi:Family of unknown function (DUF6297)